MINLSNNQPSRNHYRLPSPDPLLMDYATRTIERRYSVNLTRARIVAEMVASSVVEARQ